LALDADIPAGGVHSIIAGHRADGRRSSGVCCRERRLNTVVSLLMKVCSKCGGTRFNSWDRCMDCRNQRAKIRQARIATNGGSHTTKEWSELLARSPTCAVCGRAWSEIPSRLDSRYQHTWTKGHKVPVYRGGSDSIGNIQPECYECNFRKNAGSLKGSSIAT